MKLLLLTGLFFLSCSIAVHSQDSGAPKTKRMNYSKNPVWIQMMDDPNTNYFEAKKPFEQYWSNRPMPEIEGEGNHEAQENKKRSLFEQVFSSQEKEEQESHEYALEYKRFIRWKMEVEPFVQPDGRILSLEEQRLIWEKARL